MSDSTGTHDYCAPMKTGPNGQVTCQHLPHGTTAEPIELWIHQLGSDPGHLPADTPLPVSMAQGTNHAKIVNVQRD